jgi:hypothetical protein
VVFCSAQFPPKQTEKETNVARRRQLPMRSHCEERSDEASPLFFAGEHVSQAQFLEPLNHSSPLRARSGVGEQVAAGACKTRTMRNQGWGGIAPWAMARHCVGSKHRTPNAEHASPNA